MRTFSYFAQIPFYFSTNYCTVYIPCVYGLIICCLRFALTEHYTFFSFCSLFCLYSFLYFFLSNIKIHRVLEYIKVGPSGLYY